MKKMLSIVSAAMALTLGLTACGGGGGGDTQQGANADAKTSSEQFETVKLRVAYMPNMGSASLLVTAENKGYFDEMGLDVSLTEFGRGPEEISAMASGNIDIAQIGHGAHALCIEGEAVIFNIDATSLADMVIGNTEKGVSKVEDLKGKTVAVTGGSSSEVILNLAMADAGLTKDDVKLVEMDANGMVTAMVSGQIDACAAWSPGTITIQEALGDKAVVLADNNDYIDRATFPSSMVTTTKFAEENHDVLVRFSRALQMAADYRKANLEEVAKMVAKQCQADEKLMIDSLGEGEWLTGEFIATGIKDGTIKKYYENQQQVFINDGRIKESVPVENYVLFDIMEEAADANAAAKAA